MGLGEETLDDNWNTKSDSEYFDYMIMMQNTLGKHLDNSILTTIQKLQTPGYVEQMTITDMKSYLNYIMWDLEDLIDHEKKFKKHCEQQIKKGHLKTQ